MLADKDQKFQKLSENQQKLVWMNIKDIVNAMPIICKDPAECFFLFLQVYPEDQLLPIIGK